MTTQSIARVLTSLLASELSGLRPGTSRLAILSQIHQSQQPLTKTLHLDSIEILHLAGRVNQLFHLHESGLEDLLLTKDGIQGWAELVAQALPHTTNRLSFLTSGTTGHPKLVTHSIESLNAEVDQWKSILLASPTTVCVMTPAHHIYGMIWGVLLPERFSIPVFDCETLSPAALANYLTPGTLWIGHPPAWQYLLDSVMPFPPSLMGISSTAPLTPAIREKLVQCSFQQFLEVYGSSETGGLAYRHPHEDSYTALPKLNQLHQQGDESLIPDSLEWVDDHHVRLIGRKDHAVSVAGVNVYPSQVANRLFQSGLIRDCVIRPIELPTGVRLKAFVIPSSGDHTALENQLRDWASHHLSAPERPVSYTFGDSLPQSSTGKPTDWPINPHDINSTQP